MKIVRFMEPSEGRATYGVLEGHMVWEITGSIFGNFQKSGRSYASNEVKMVAPLIPNEIIGIGKNYVPNDQTPPTAPELPILFFKPKTCVVGPGEDIIIPIGLSEIMFEAELAVVIGKSGRNLKESEVKEHIYGYTVANDVSTLSYFHPDGHWTVGKAFDTFCPLGPLIETDLNLLEIRVQSRTNGILRQDSSISQMVTSIEQMICFASRFMTLSPGDVLLTGTPDGMGSVRAGDSIECIIEGIGTLHNKVRHA